jgi:dimethylhistidine N-methyltransferase
MAKTRLLRTQYHDRLGLSHLHHLDLRKEFRDAVERGLSATPKGIPPKYFYDRRGSELFERITQTEEYYPTRTEAWILTHHGENMIEAAGNPGTLVEFGSGNSAKTRVLLNVLAARHDRIRYVPIDISASVVQAYGPQLLAEYPTLTISGLITDYRHALDALMREPGTARLFLFLGSSLGNFDMAEALAFLREIAKALQPEDRFLLGVDLIKPSALLNRAYNDREGVTAAFNLNLLARINRELEGEFDLARFRHLAFFNKRESRVEMHLESLREQIVRIAALGRAFPFAQGETIHTENSYKYDYATLARLFADAGLALQQRWIDPNEWFALNLLRKG